MPAPRNDPPAPRGYVFGAKAFGYRVAWCNRTAAPAEELGLGPDLVIATLNDLPA
jgi:2-haloacid dehalogenase